MKNSIWWLWKYLPIFFKRPPLFNNLLRFLEGRSNLKIKNVSGDRESVSVEIFSGAGELLYSRTPHRTHILEEVEFIPIGEIGFSFTLIDSELLILRYNGSGVEHSPKISTTETCGLVVFMNNLRHTVNECLNVAQRK